MKEETVKALGDWNEKLSEQQHVIEVMQTTLKNSITKEIKAATRSLKESHFDDNYSNINENEISRKKHESYIEKHEVLELLKKKSAKEDVEMAFR